MAWCVERLLSFDIRWKSLNTRLLSPLLPALDAFTSRLEALISRLSRVRNSVILYNRDIGRSEPPEAEIDMRIKRIATDTPQYIIPLTCLCKKWLISLTALKCVCIHFIFRIHFSKV